MNTSTEGEKNPGQTTIETTLHDLIETISGEVDPGEDKMIVTTVSHIHGGRLNYSMFRIS